MQFDGQCDRMEKSERADGRHAKRTAKDSVFTDLFSQKKYLLELYRVLHPEDREVSAEDLTDVTINNVLADGQYNDLGFTVKQRLMVLVEAQSTWSVNILVRSFLYLAQSYAAYFQREEIKLHQTAKISLPKPELYVIYTGEGKKPDILSLQKEYFDGEATSLEVQARVLCGENPADIVGQYVRFAKIHTEEVRRCGNTMDAILYTLRRCKAENVLDEYLTLREKEVIAMKWKFITQEEVMEEIERDARKEGRREGEKFGERKSSLAIGRMMKTDGEPVEKIARYTGLTLKEIEAL